MRRKGVAAVGVSTDPKFGYVISIHLENAASRSGLPDEIKGVPVQYKVTGRYRLFNAQGRRAS